MRYLLRHGDVPGNGEKNMKRVVCYDIMCANQMDDLPGTCMIPEKCDKYGIPYEYPDGYNYTWKENLSLINPCIGHRHAETPIAGDYRFRADGTVLEPAPDSIIQARPDFFLTHEALSNMVCDKCHRPYRGRVLKTTNGHGHSMPTRCVYCGSKGHHQTYIFKFGEVK